MAAHLVDVQAVRVAMEYAGLGAAADLVNHVVLVMAVVAQEAADVTADAAADAAVVVVVAVVVVGCFVVTDQLIHLC